MSLTRVLIFTVGYRHLVNKMRLYATLITKSTRKGAIGYGNY